MKYSIPSGKGSDFWQDTKRKQYRKATVAQAV